MPYVKVSDGRIRLENGDVILNKDVDTIYPDLYGPDGLIKNNHPLVFAHVDINPDTKPAEWNKFREVYPKEAKSLWRLVERRWFVLRPDDILLGADVAISIMGDQPPTSDNLLDGKMMAAYHAPNYLGRPCGLVMALNYTIWRKWEVEFSSDGGQKSRPKLTGNPIFSQELPLP